jgi:uncharacterized integral membrane protein
MSDQGSSGDAVVGGAARPAGAAARPAEQNWVPRLIVGGVALVLAVIFIAQNSERVQATFYFWDAEARLWVVILVSLVLGAMLGQLVPAVIRRRRARRRPTGTGSPV